MNRRQILSYLPWQLWDFLWDRGIAVLFTGALLATSIVWPGYVALSAQMPAEVVPTELLKVVVAQIVSILVVISASGIVANDRIGGYYRFLFSKPVRLPVYYAVHFLVALVGLLAVALVLLSAFWLLVGWVPPTVPFVMIVVSFFALGGTIFFFSTFTRFDWALLVVLWGASALARTIFPDAAWYRVARWALPPVHQLDKLRAALFAGAGIDWGGFAWLVGYGLLFFFAGLVVLQRKAIAE